MVTSFKIDEETSKRMKAAIDNYNDIIGEYRKKISEQEQNIKDVIAEIKSHIQPTEPNKMDNREFNAAFYIALDIIKKHTGVDDTE